MKCVKVSEIPNLLKLSSGSHDFLRTVRQKISTEERDFTFSSIETFDTRIFPEG